ncbi:MAG: hypothetical protein AAGD07_14735 [Planctomycetota bacterium]
MKALVKRFWAPVVILIMVASHAAVIGYIRSRVAHLNQSQSNAVEIGLIRFQNQADPDHTYQFDLHAMVDPTRRFQSEERLSQMRLEIIEASEQVLRQVDRPWLDDPTHQDIRGALMDVVLKNLDEPLVQRVLITDWLRSESRITL